ncbi:ribosomal protein S12 methylthiotransferase accessory factor [Streptomyces canus]|uniref:YcaO-like family protein n=1 Tax=Streptomyces canus TaxID=58343 RepID=UPI0027860A5A|nr:YcaO-like family protein [Streptomyces canus]MDQ0605307.1 ribosomal protein S12 methylthiotransferase accessory factor [Streptomyces canus]
MGQSGQGTDGTLAALRRIVSPYGIVARTEETRARVSDRSVYSCLSVIGSGLAGVAAACEDPELCKGVRLESAGHAELVAIAEGAERYASMAPFDEEPIWARAMDLAEECLEPHRYPRCSAGEYAHEKAPLVPFDEGAEVRWVRGLDLIKGEPLWVPAVMVNYALASAVPAERFCNRISTGYAVHTDPVEAVLRAAFEVIERDSVAVTWLQRLPLRPVAEDEFTEGTRELIAWFEGRFMEPVLLDATSELGVPTVYCLIAADHDPRASRFVTASAGRCLAEAAESALLEAMNLGDLIHAGEAAHSIDEIAGNVVDSARFMAIGTRSHAFDFLLEGRGRSASRSAAPRLPEDPVEALDGLVDRLSQAGMQVAVVDRTTQDVREAGLTAVTVVIPDLQPMSVDPRAQFRGHSRLFTAPKHMGHRVLPEEELNPWPQPFA